MYESVCLKLDTYQRKKLTSAAAFPQIWGKVPFILSLKMMHGHFNNMLIKDESHGKKI